jgi:SM-20-related protein
MLSEADLDALAAGQMVVRDGVLGLDLPVLATLVSAGELVGTGRSRVQGERGDRVVWLEPSAAISPLVALFDDLRAQLNREVWLGLGRYELQLACFSPGARYARHRDAFRGTARGGGRRLTAIWYPNVGWSPEDGGALRVWGGDHYRDVLPVHDRLVVFASEVWEHEVLPPNRPRLAVTAWYHGREDVPM